MFRLAYAFKGLFDCEVKEMQDTIKKQREKIEYLQAIIEGQEDVIESVRSELLVISYDLEADNRY